MDPVHLYDTCYILSREYDTVKPRDGVHFDVQGLRRFTRHLDQTYRRIRDMDVHFTEGVLDELVHFSSRFGQWQEKVRGRSRKKARRLLQNAGSLLGQVVAEGYMAVPAERGAYESLERMVRAEGLARGAKRRFGEAYDNGNTTDEELVATGLSVIRETGVPVTIHTEDGDIARLAKCAVSYLVKSRDSLASLLSHRPLRVHFRAKTGETYQAFSSKK